MNKKLAMFVGSLVGGGASVLIGIAPAHADATSQYLANLRAAGFGNYSDSDLIDIGEGICGHLRDGSSIVTLQQAWAQELIPKGGSRQQAVWLVNFSRTFLCPGTGSFQ